MMETTTDAFLGGRLQIRQPKHGYRAGADPVFLAASVPAKPGELVLELGCGVGVAALCLLHRVQGAQVTGVELQPELAALARENAEANRANLDVVTADLSEMPDSIRSRDFDHVMMNPPFFDRSSGSPAFVPGRETGRGLTLELSTWLDTGLRRLKPGGTLTLINRIESLPECLFALQNRAGGITVAPLSARKGRAAKSFVLRAKKGARSGFVLLPPFVLHRGEHHEKDGENHTDFAQDILRKGRAFDLAP